MTMNLSSPASSSSPSSFEDLDKKPSARNDHPHRQKISSNNISENEEAKEDVLTVFYAAPLVWKSKDGAAHAMKVIDFEFEREVLSKTFQEACSAEASIRVEYEIATMDRLGLFLARGKGRILHFSCHGHPTFLALENGWGDLTMLDVSRLQEWISAGGQNLQFVFVSACKSASIGEAFVRAGVPHVLCCRIDGMLREDAAGAYVVVAPLLFCSARHLTM
jgi:hypothetical protein